VEERREGRGGKRGEKGKRGRGMTPSRPTDVYR